MNSARTARTRPSAFEQLKSLLSRRKLRQPLQLTEDHLLSMLMLRRGREEAFGRMLFSDPAWDILLELYAAHLAKRQMSFADLVAAIPSPESTISRWVSALVEHDIVERLGPDRKWVVLTEKGTARMRRLASHWGSAFLSI